ncbi:MAG: hypothetical protein WAK71_23590 [Streptosporangiaceae bacterium]
MNEPPATEPETDPETDPESDDRIYALGQVVERAAVMEIALRMAFCALIGGRYGAIVAGSEEAHTLIENCDAITRQHTGIQPDQQGAIRAALRACRGANHERNRLVHDAWGTRQDGAPATLHSARRSYQITGRTWSVDQIRGAAEAITDAQRSLLDAVEDALGPASLQAAAEMLAQHASQRSLQ